MDPAIAALIAAARAVGSEVVSVHRANTPDPFVWLRCESEGVAAEVAAELSMPAVERKADNRNAWVESQAVHDGVRILVVGPYRDRARVA